MSQDKDAPILRIAASDQSNELNDMLLQGRSLSGRERNCVFLNTLSSDPAEGRFATISAISGMDFPDDGQAAARVDWDQDGDIDLILTNRTAPRARFMRNENPSGNGYLQLLLKGNGEDTNCDAIGARVIVTLNEKDKEGQSVRLLRTVRAGDGYLTQSSKCLHFGLGNDAEIEQIEIHWPNREGETEILTGIERNHRYEVVQGSGTAQKVAPRETPSALEPKTTEVPEVDETMRIPLINQFLAPTLTYENFDNETTLFPLPENEMVLVNLWSSTCQPCIKELKEFSHRYEELQDAGVNVLAINIDELQDMPDGLALAKAMAERMKFPFTAGMASPEVIAELQRLHNSLLQMNRPLPMPTSFLIDRKGYLHTIYKGAVEVDTLLSDAQKSDLDLMGRFRKAVVRKGSVLQGPLVNKTMLRNEGAALIRLGKEYLKEGKFDRAEAILNDALVKMPGTAAIHNQLAIMHEQKARRGIPGALDLAMKNYRDAISFEPEKPSLRVNLAQLLIRQKAYDEAAGHLTYALNHGTETAAAHYNMGMIYSSQGDLENEKLSYEKALAINPEHPQSLFRLGRIFEKQQSLEEAKTYYQRAVDQAPQNPLLLTSLGRVLAAKSELHTAESLFRKAIRIQPRYAEAHFQLGGLFFANGDLAAAQKKFLETLKIDRNHRGAAIALQRIQSATNPGNK